MVNNSNNINKSNNHWTLQKGGQRHMTLEIQVLSWDRQRNMAELNHLMYLFMFMI